MSSQEQKTSTQESAPQQATPSKRADWGDRSEEIEQSRSTAHESAHEVTAEINTAAVGDLSTRNTPERRGKGFQSRQDSHKQSTTPKGAKTESVTISVTVKDDGVARVVQATDDSAPESRRKEERTPKGRELPSTHWSNFKLEPTDGPVCENKTPKQRRDRRSQGSTDVVEEDDNEEQTDAQKSVPHLNMKHGFVRDIVRNQLDRDAYEQQWQQKQREKETQLEEQKKTNGEKGEKEETRRRRRETKKEDDVTMQPWSHNAYEEMIAQEEKAKLERQQKMEEEAQKRREKHEERMKSRKPLSDTKALYVPPSRRDGYQPRLPEDVAPASDASPSKTDTPATEGEVEKAPKEQTTSSKGTPRRGSERNERRESRGSSNARSEAAASPLRHAQTHTPTKSSGTAKHMDAGKEGASPIVSSQVDEAKQATTEESQKSHTSSDATPIIIVGIELPDGGNQRVEIFKGDDINAVAHAFCEKHSLSLSHADTIQKLIQENLQRLQA